MITITSHLFCENSEKWNYIKSVISFTLNVKCSVLLLARMWLSSSACWPHKEVPEFFYHMFDTLKLCSIISLFPLEIEDHNSLVCVKDLSTWFPFQQKELWCCPVASQPGATSAAFCRDRGSCSHCFLASCETETFKCIYNYNTFIYITQGERHNNIPLKCRVEAGFYNLAFFFFSLKQYVSKYMRLEKKKKNPLAFLCYFGKSDKAKQK